MLLSHIQTNLFLSHIMFFHSFWWQCDIKRKYPILFYSVLQYYNDLCWFPVVSYGRGLYFPPLSEEGGIRFVFVSMNWHSTMLVWLDIVKRKPVQPFTKWLIRSDCVSVYYDWIRVLEYCTDLCCCKGSTVSCCLASVTDNIALFELKWFLHIELIFFLKVDFHYHSRDLLLTCQDLINGKFSKQINSKNKTIYLYSV